MLLIKEEFSYLRPLSFAVRALEIPPHKHQGGCLYCLNPAVLHDKVLIKYHRYPYIQNCVLLLYVNTIIITIDDLVQHS